MAELRIHDQSSTFYKSLRSRGTDVNVDLNLPDRSGIILTEKELMDILNRESKLNADAIMKPDITETPIDANGFAGPIPIATYKTSETFLGEHEKTEWIASDTADFHRITDGSSNKIFKTSWYPNLTTSGEQVYVKYRFRSGNIVSPWSDTLAFKGTVQGIITPSITVEENGLEPTIKISQLAYYGTFPGIEHMSTSWVIEDAEGNKVVERPLDTVNKVKLVIAADVLDPKKEYTIYVTQHTNVAQPAWAKSKTAIGEYVIPKSKIERPVLRYDDSGDPKIIGSAFSGEGAHLATEWMIYNDLGAKIAEFSYDTIKLTSFPMKDFVSQGRKYRITARYITAEARSPRGSINIEIPAPNTGDVNVVSGMNINPSTADRGLSLDVVPFESPIREDIQYWRYQVRFDLTDGMDQSTSNFIHTETDTSQEVEDSWNKSLRRDFTPAQSWLTWFPNSNVVNPRISITGTSVRMGLKTEVRNRAQLQIKTFEYNLGNATWENSNTLNPLIKISDSTGADVAWMGYRGTEWTLSKKTGTTAEGNPIWTKVRVENSTDKSKHRLNGLETDTEYRVTVVHKTNCFCFAKHYEFRSASYIMASPVVAMEGSGKKWKIKSSGYSLTNYTGPNGQHGSTSYLVTKKNTGEKVWENLKDTVNKTTANIPESVLELGQEYNVRVIFHSASGISSEASTVSFYIKPYSAAHDGAKSSIGEGVIFPTKTTFIIKNFRVTDLGTGASVSTEPLAKVTWTLEVNNGTEWVRKDGVEKYAGANNDPTKWTSLAVIDPSTHGVRLKTICYSVNDIASEEVTTSFTISDIYIDTCDDYWTLISGNIKDGGLLVSQDGNNKIIPARCVHWDLVDDHLPRSTREYLGEWGLKSNFLYKNGDESATNFPSKYIPFNPGDRVSYKGKLYQAKTGATSQNLAQTAPDISEHWEEITKDLRLPSPIEVLNAMGLNWNVCTEYKSGLNGYVKYVGRNQRENKYLGHIPKFPAEKDYNTVDTNTTGSLYSKQFSTSISPWIKMISPTTKKVAYFSSTPLLLEGISVADILYRHHEYFEIDKFTFRFGTRLYYVRLPTIEEYKMFYDHPSAHYYVDVSRETNKLSYHTAQDINVVDYDRYKVWTNVDDYYNYGKIEAFDKANLCVVLTPIKEDEAPYNKDNIIYKYRKFPIPAISADKTDMISYDTMTTADSALYDNHYFPNNLPLLYDKFTDTGYFGRIKYTLLNRKLINLFDFRGLIDNNFSSDQWYDVYYYHGMVGLVPSTQRSVNYGSGQHTPQAVIGEGFMFGCKVGQNFIQYKGNGNYVNNSTNVIFKLNISALTMRTYNYNLFCNVSEYSIMKERGYFKNKNGGGVFNIYETSSKNNMLADLLYKTLDPDELASKFISYRDVFPRYDGSGGGASRPQALEPYGTSMGPLTKIRNTVLSNVRVRGQSFNVRKTKLNGTNDLALFSNKSVTDSHRAKVIGKDVVIVDDSLCYSSSDITDAVSLGEIKYTGSGGQYGYYRPWIKVLPAEIDMPNVMKVGVMISFKLGYSQSGDEITNTTATSVLLNKKLFKQNHYTPLFKRGDLIFSTLIITKDGTTIGSISNLNSINPFIGFNTPILDDLAIVSKGHNIGNTSTVFDIGYGSGTANKLLICKISAKGDKDVILGRYNFDTFNRAHVTPRPDTYGGSGSYYNFGFVAWVDKNTLDVVHLEDPIFIPNTTTMHVSDITMAVLREVHKSLMR
nr:MAG TPA: hypothetical protein [Caudoviricetes sp.]